MNSIIRYEILRKSFVEANPAANELELISACINFARACNLYKVESELLKQHDSLADEINRRELAQIKK